MTALDRSKASRRPLYILLAVFFVPLVVAFALYYGGLWRPAESTEHGDLVHPARPLPEASLVRMDGTPASPTLLRERWSLVYIGGGDCDARCRSALADIHRARQMLGKDMPRVQSVFLATSKCCDPALLTDFPDTHVLRSDTAEAAPFLATFPVYYGVPVAEAGRIYIVDPLGNLMMSYAPTASSTGMYQDIKKLLKLSHIG